MAEATASWVPVGSIKPLQKDGVEKILELAVGCGKLGV